MTAEPTRQSGLSKCGLLGEVPEGEPCGYEDRRRMFGVVLNENTL